MTSFADALRMKKKFGAHFERWQKATLACPREISVKKIKEDSEKPTVFFGRTS
jgi:hypothetical protein